MSENIASASLTSLFYAFEEADGTIDASAVFKPIRLNEGGNTLAFQATRIASEESRGDRHRTADRRGSFSVQGELTGQLAAGALDDFFLAGFCGVDWASRVTKTATDFGVLVNTATPDGIIQGAAMAYVAGDIIAVSGFANAANNGKFRVATASATELTVTALDGGEPGLVNEAAGESVTIATQQRLITGVERRTMAILERHTDVNVDYLYTGVEVNTVTISGVAQEKYVVAFGVLGRNQEELAAIPGGWTFDAATTSDFMTALDGLLLVAGEDFGIATEYTAAINNGIEQKYAIARPSSIASSIAPITAEGSLSAYFRDALFYRRFLTDVDTVILLEATDGASGYRIGVPRGKFVEGSKQAVGTDVIVALSYSAGYDQTANSELYLERY